MKRYYSLGLFVLFCANVYFLWPGQMFSDSQTQLQQALSGTYDYHHPPIMGVIWYYFYQLVSGSGLMLLFHLVLLYLAAAVFFITFYPQCISYYYLVLPLIPNIVIYSSCIWKDVGFTFTYLLVAALLSYCTIHKKRMSWLIVTVVLLLLFYGTAVKFQARYIAPLFIFWFVATYLQSQMLSKKVVLWTILLCAALYSAQNSFNRYWIGPVKENYSWQFVKLYDLAGMSIILDEPLFPDFIKNQPRYSFEKVKKQFNYERVDDLTRDNDSPLSVGVNKQEGGLLFQYWMQKVLDYPMEYVLHRFNLFWVLITNYPLQRLEHLDLTCYKGLSKITQLNVALQILALLRYFLSLIFVLPILLAFTALSFFLRNKTVYALPLFILNCASLLLLFILFFFSMASSLRYVYFVFCMFYASQGFVFLCLKEWLKLKKVGCDG